MSKSFIFLVKSFLGNFYRHLATFYWSHWSVRSRWCYKYTFCGANQGNPKFKIIFQIKLHFQSSLPYRVKTMGLSFLNELCKCTGWSVKMQTFRSLLAKIYSESIDYMEYVVVEWLVVWQCQQKGWLPLIWSILVVSVKEYIWILEFAFKKMCNIDHRCSGHWKILTI